MAKSQSRERTTLSVKDFGPIAQASVELRPFTVFVGASTGKSYLAILLYALHQFFGQLTSPLGPAHLPSRQSPSHGHRQMSDDQIEATSRWLQRTLEARDKNEEVSLPDEVAAFVRPLLEDVGEIGTLLDAEVRRCFGMAERRDLIRQPAAKRAQIALRRALRQSTTGGYDLTLTPAHYQLKAAIPAATLLRVRRQRLHDLHWWQGERALTERLLNELAGLVVPQMIGAFARPAHYLPADRAGVMHAHRVVVSALVGHMARAGLAVETPLSTLSGVLADFLERLIELGDERVTATARLAKRLETEYSAVPWKLNLRSWLSVDSLPAGHMATSPPAHERIFNGVRASARRAVPAPYRSHRRRTDH